MAATMRRVERPGRDEFDEVVDTLCAAFRDYPVMRYVLKEAGGRFDEQLVTLIGYFTDSRFSRGYPVLGVRSHGGLAAAATINPPRALPAPATLEARFERMRDELGAAAIARFEAFARASEAFQPAGPHYYLGMIGVRPEHRGEGLARLLLDELHAMSARDAESTGVALTTELPRNLPLYERFGYRILGEGHADELTTWIMFRPDPG